MPFIQRNENEPCLFQKQLRYAWLKNKLNNNKICQIDEEIWHLWGKTNFHCEVMNNIWLQLSLEINMLISQFCWNQMCFITSCSWKMIQHMDMRMFFFETDPLLSVSSFSLVNMNCWLRLRREVVIWSWFIVGCARQFSFLQDTQSTLQVKSAFKSRSSNA